MKNNRKNKDQIVRPAVMSDVSEPDTRLAEYNDNKMTKRKLKVIRLENSDKFKRVNFWLLVLFPIFICCMAEINQAKYVIPFLEFCGDRPTVLMFDIVLSAVFFVVLTAIFRKAWLSMAVQSFIYMALSTTELFKYGTNGNHLILSDMKLFRSVKSLTSFAYIKITPRLIIYYLIVILFVLLAFWFNPIIKNKPLTRMAAVGGCLIPCAALIVTPSFYKPVYEFFQVDTTRATNSFLLNEKFSKNRFLAFLIETASESYANRLVIPKDYSEERMDEIMNIPVDTADDFHGGKKPNVIVIMSESFADFRVFDQLDIDEKYYELFDKALSEGHPATAITPTYASWTVRSEFELLFGLPVRGLNTPNMPQRVLAEREQPALAQYYKSWGYDTVYIHPFQRGFYSRSRIYGYFGFDKMIFHDDAEGTTDFNVPVKHFGTYVDDATVFDQIMYELKNTDSPIYLHTTTMQNHQPYNQGEDPTAEFDNYLDWIQHSNEGLDKFLSELKKFDEPTLVFFVGDHFPSLRGETSVYNQLGLSGENCDRLYQQKCFFWSNYDADFSAVPDSEFSFFYVPYIILNVIDAPKDAFIEKMNGFLEKVPVYSSEYNSSIPRNEELDIITIDRVVEDEFTPSPIPEEQLTTSR